ncbi:hypothetical protein [Methanobrevibacter sp.]
MKEKSKITPAPVTQKQENKVAECNVNIDFRRMVDNSQKSSFASEKKEVHK